MEINMRSIFSSIKLYFLRSIFSLFNHNSFFCGTLAWLCSKSIKEITSDGKFTNFKSGLNKGMISALFLSHEKFRDDPFILSATKKVRVLIIKNYWQSRLVNIFYTKGPVNSAALQAMVPYGPLVRPQERFHAFLRIFLTSLYKIVHVDCVISSDVRNEYDFDWGVVSKEIGRAYIAFHRENLVASLKSYNTARYRMNKHKRFRGNHIIVHNNIEKKMFNESGYVDESQISALGCLRMDNFIKRIKNGNLPKTKKKRFLFFSFDIPSVGIDVYHKVLLAVIQLTTQYPEIDFIIKPKPDFYHKGEKNTMDKIFKEAEVCLDKIQNLQILPYVDAQSLILESDVICAINSTVMLEAGIAGKPIIVPFFKECQKSDDRLNNIKLKEYFHLFEVAIDDAELKSKILKHLRSPIKISEEVMEGRKKVFEDFVSSMDADATERYVSLLRSMTDVKVY